MTGQFGQGVGDLLTLLCAASNMTPIAVNTKHKDWLDLFAGFTHTDENATLPLDHVWQDEMQEQGGIQRHSRYANALDTTAGIPKAKLPIGHYGERYRDHILMFPFSAWKGREYPLVNYIHIYRELEAQGEQVIVMAPDHHNLLDLMSFSHRKKGLKPAKVFDMISTAKMVIGNDSAPIHLAGIAGTKAIALCGPTDGKVAFGHYPSVEVLQGSLPCNKCYWSTRDYIPPCHTFCANLASIHPSAVINTLWELKSRVHPRLQLI